MCPGVRAVIVSAVCLLVLGLGAGAASAAWSHDPAVCVPMTWGSGCQGFDAIVPDGAGGAIAVWLGAQGKPLVAQHITSTGVVDWPGNGASLSTPSFMARDWWAAAASDGAGGAIVAWTRYPGVINDSIRVQRVDASGAVKWGADGVLIQGSAVLAGWTDIISDGSGGAFVSWNRVGAVYVQRVNASGAPQWVPPTLCGSPPSANPTARLVSDGSGGVIVVWEDMRGGSGNHDIYAQRVNGAGAIQWSAGGEVVCAAVGDQEAPRIISDGSGGAIMVWKDHRSGSDYDIYVQRMNGSGLPQWGPNGLAVCTATGDQVDAVLSTDGSSGAIIAWSDARGANADLYVQRVLGVGSCAPGWTADGVPVCTAGGDQLAPSILAGPGEAIVSWQDGRVGRWDIYAQRIDTTSVVLWSADGVPVSFGYQGRPWLATDLSDGAGVVFTTGEVCAAHLNSDGTLGGPEPYVVSVRDVPNDQGGKVKVSWQASTLDIGASPTIESYWVWRSAPPQAALAALKQGAQLFSASAPWLNPGGRTFLTTMDRGMTYYWEYLVSQPAGHLPRYSYVAPTTSDSIAGSNPLTAFLIQARTAGGTSWWFSNPDSGYSVDNLPPEGLLYLYGVYAYGGTALHWPESPEQDLGLYHVHRGTSADFVPGPGNLIASQRDTGYFDPGPCARYYKVSALDIHGNEGPFKLLTPGNTTGAPVNGATFEFSLRVPSPVHGAAELRFALPAEGQAALTVFDVSGRQVRRLVAGRLAAGPHSVGWDLTDGGGRMVPSALYFVRLEAGTRSLTRRLLVTR